MMAESQLTNRRPLDERRAILQHEMYRWLPFGYRVLSQAETSAQLVRPKQFSFPVALLLVFTVVGFPIYVLWYLTRRDHTAYLEVDDSGRILLDGRPYGTTTATHSVAGATATSAPTRQRNLVVTFKIIGPVVLMSVVLSGMAAYLSSGNVPRIPPAEIEVRSGSGMWNNYAYTYSSRKSNETIVTFNPFLPRDDQIVVAAIRHLSRELLSTNIDAAEPFIADRRGQSVIAFQDGIWRVSFLPIKETTGDVHSIVMRRE
jgi:hypothetical protein